MSLALAINIASRSTIRTHKTGAVIVTGGASPGRVLSTGWSHESELQLKQFRSIHAELHAVIRASRGKHPIRLPDDSVCFVATVSRAGNVTVGKPCQACRATLYEAGIRKVVYTMPNKKWGALMLSERSQAQVIYDKAEGR